MTKITAANIGKASFTATEAGTYLPLAAKAAIDGKAKIDEGKAKGAAALAIMVAGFASDEAAARPWTFDVKASDGAVHYHVECTGFEEHGGTEGAWRYNGEGKVSKDAQGAYKRGFQAAFFNLPEGNAAVWTMTGKAIHLARAIREEGMTATIEAGELKLEGGAGTRADAMRGAKSLAALKKAADGEAGTNREGHGNAKGGEGDEARAATPSEICAAAALLAKRVAKGDEAICNAALSSLRAIAALVAANPEAFSED